MDNSSLTIKTIPHDYSCRMVFRCFAKTMMHEHSHFLRRDRVFFWDDGVGVPRRHYCDRNACLEHYLSMGWPNADQGARWKSRERIAVFAKLVIINATVLLPHVLLECAQQVVRGVIQQFSLGFCLSLHCGFHAHNLPQGVR